MALGFYLEQVKREVSVYSFKGISEGWGNVCFVSFAGRIPLIMFEMFIRHPKREIQEVAGYMHLKCEDQF